MRQAHRHKVLSMKKFIRSAVTLGCCFAVSGLAAPAPQASSDPRLDGWVTMLKNMRSGQFGHTFHWEHVTKGTQDAATIQRVNEMLVSSMQAQAERVRKRGLMEQAQALEESMRKQVEERVANGIPESFRLLTVESHAADSYLVEERKLAGAQPSGSWHAAGNGLCYQTIESVKRIRILKETAARDSMVQPPLPFVDFPGVFGEEYAWSQVEGGSVQDILRLKAAHKNADLHFLVDVSESSLMPVKITGMREGRAFYVWEAVGLMKVGTRMFPKEITVKAFYSNRDVPDAVNMWKLTDVALNSRVSLPLLPHLDPAYIIFDETVSRPVAVSVKTLLRAKAAGK